MFFEIGGFIAGAILVAFGVVAIVMGFNGRSTVTDSLKQENIVGSADMTPALIVKEAKAAGLTASDVPSMSVAGKAINSGRPRPRIRQLHADSRPRGDRWLHLRPDGPVPGQARRAEGTAGSGRRHGQPAVGSDRRCLKQPVSNGARDLWVTETALTTALNTSYMADKLGLFGIVVGFALFLSGIGFVVLAYAALHRKQDARLT